MLRGNRQGPTVASIRRAIQQGLDRPESPHLGTLTSSQTTATPDLFQQANVNFSDKKWVWVPHDKEGFIAGYITEELPNDRVKVHLMTGRDELVSLNDTEKVNPPKFEKVEDMADLGYLNEASVVHNLKQRYASNMIYTYSGLFLVAVNPYYDLQIYGSEFVAAYRNKKRNEMAPHIFAIADAAFHDMLHSKENQSILITGESGAGKTENTKKVIQYLTAIAGDRNASGGAVSGSSLEQQVLSANPILESFGNAQTIRNNNSSRFGKFIRIEFNFAGQIAGANIEWYLLEKPRVTHQSKLERNYHIFYQFMRGASKTIKDKLLIDQGPEGYTFTKRCRTSIQGVDDSSEFDILTKALATTGFKPEDQQDLFRIIAAILHLGNMQFQATRNDEAVLKEQVAAEKLCHVLGIQLSEFMRALLRPSIKAGRDWVTQSRNLEQVVFSVEALARSMYERMFGNIVSRINAAMNRPDGKSTFIGVLDIAGFEILETNSYEQLCINYTNERLQQFFNRTMFVLEQEEYKREGIEWNFIDFGMDLQPTIDLIDRTKPIGIMSCLDEECVMPKATDKTFTEKLHALWNGKSDKYEVPRFAMGFTIKHYASNVEYSTVGWLEKNKDPLNENVTKLLGNSSEPYVAQLYADYSDAATASSSVAAGDSANSRATRVATTLKRGAFRTVGQRHKDQLNLLMAQLNSTQPHFVRCILPNSEKRAGKIDTPLVLDQLRCNGVLEGIRITRQGFPNRVPFPEFRQRYEILAPNTIPRQVFVDSKQAVSLLLEALRMDKAKYRLGHTKVFFRAGVLAELEETRDAKLSKIIAQFQAVARGALSRARFRRRIEQAKAIRVIQRNARVYNQLCEWPWWKLYRTVKPLLHVTRIDEEMRKKDSLINDLERKAATEEEERKRLESEWSELERTKTEIESLLISERSAALDQEEILKRTQEREVALEESLREHAVRLEELEELCEELVRSKAELEESLQSAELQMQTEVGTMRDLTAKNQESHEALAMAEAELQRVRELAEQLDQSSSQAEMHAQQLTEELAQAHAHTAQVSEELDQMHKELADRDAALDEQATRELELSNVSAQVTADLAKLQSALDDATRQRDQARAEVEQNEKQTAELKSRISQLDKDRSDLAIKLQSTEQSLAILTADKQKLAEANQQMVQEITELRDLIDEKADQGTRESELRRMREQELAKLRTELADISGELDEFRRAHIESEQAMQGEIEQIRRERDQAVQERDGLEFNSKEIEQQLHEHAGKLEELEGANMELERQLTEATTKSREIESVFADTKQTKDAAELRLDTLGQQLTELTGERESLKTQLAAAQGSGEKERVERVAVESELATAMQTIKELQARLEENEVVKDEFQQRITTQSQEYEDLKVRFHQEADVRNKQLEDARLDAVAELDDLRSGYNEIEARCADLERARTRLTSELEDTKLEAERERSHAVELEDANSEFRDRFEQTEQELANMQAEIDRLVAEVAKRDQHIDELANGKADTERELKTSQSDMEQVIADLRAKLDAEVAARSKATEIKDRWEAQHQEYQETIERELAAKDSEADQARQQFLAEIADLGKKLDDQTLTHESLLRQNQDLQADLQRVKESADQSTKTRDAVELAKREMSTQLREAEISAESLRKAVDDYKATADRHEKKAGALQEIVRARDLELTQLGRKLQRTERRLEEVMAQAAYHLDARNRLDSENVELREKLEQACGQLGDAQTTVRDLGNLGRTAKADSDSMRRVEREAAQQIQELEQSRLALSAALRTAQQDFEEKQNELVDLDRSFGAVQDELESMHSQLLTAERERNEAVESLASLKEQLSTERSMRGNNEELTNELSEKLEEMRERLASYESTVQEAADQKRYADKVVGGARAETRELRESLEDSIRARNAAEDRVRQMEADALQLQARIDDNAFAIAELEQIRDGLQQELGAVSDRHRGDIDDHDRVMDELRAKYQGELEETTAELENIKKDHIELREAYINLDSDLALKAQDLDRANEEAVEAKRELMRVMAKLEELVPAYEEARDTAKQLEEDLAKAKRDLDSAMIRTSEAESLRDEMRTVKEKVEARLDELQDKYIEASRGRQTAEKAALQLEDEVKSARAKLSEINEDQTSAEDRVTRLDAVVADAHLALDKEREANTLLTKEKNNLEKQIKGLKLRIVELEAEAVAFQAKGNKRFQPVPADLASKLEAQAKVSLEDQQKLKQMERQIRELQFQIGEKDMSKQRNEMDMQRMTNRVKRLEEQIRELEETEQQLTVAKHRLERELGSLRSRNGSRNGTPNSFN